MATISKLTVSHAKEVDGANWATVRDAFRPRDVLSKAPRGDCVVEAVTALKNVASKWTQIKWKGGIADPNEPNRRIIKRYKSGKVSVEASIGNDKKKVDLWIILAEVKILTSGPRPKLAVPWSQGALFSGPDRCGAFVVGSLSTGENARGQVVAVAEISPPGIGRLLNDAKKYNQWKLRRQLTAHDFIDGRRYKHRKSFVPWVADDSPAGMLMLNPVTNDRVYDSDTPDLPSVLKTAETYNNFRQWVEWDGTPCSNYAYWHFKALWKSRKVTAKEVGSGTIALPTKPTYR